MDWRPEQPIVRVAADWSQKNGKKSGDSYFVRDRVGLDTRLRFDNMRHVAMQRTHIYV